MSAGASPCFHEYVLVAAASIEEHHLLLSGIPAGPLPHVERNVTALVHVVRQGVVPFARRNAQKAGVAVTWIWPQDFHCPPPPSQPVPRSHFVTLV